jgi:hypothetical protein
VQLSEEELKFRHRFCVSQEWMRRHYLRSAGYEVVNNDGEYDPNGSRVRRPSGKIILLGSECDHPEDGECAAHKVKDADREVLPPPDRSDFLVKGDDPVMDRLEELLAQVRGTN